MLVMVIALMVPYVPVPYMPTLSTISLLVPILVIINFVFAIFWVLKKNKKFWISGILLLFWYLLLGPFYQFGKDQPSEMDESLSVMSFNVRSFNKYDWIKNTEIDEDIMSLIDGQSPDILCFQEFSMIKKRNFKEYPYHYETPGGTNKSFQILFSKHPIIKGGTLDFPSTVNNGLFIDVAYAGDTIRIYNVHLQSFRIVPEIETIKNEESSKLLNKSRRVMLKQYEQANLIQKSMAQSDYKKIVVGDFNNTQYSNVYQIIKGDLNDSFQEKGKGFGRTYNLMGFPMRIDYILTDPAFEVVSHQNFNERLSDHYPVMTTLRLKSQ